MPAKRQRNQVCIFCAEKVSAISFRDTDVLRKFTSGQNKILPRKKTGSCAKHQRLIAKEVKRSRQMGLMGYRGH